MGHPPFNYLDHPHTARIANTIVKARSDHLKTGFRLAMIVPIPNSKKPAIPSKKTPLAANINIPFS
jgi:hypothetical protein